MPAITPDHPDYDEGNLFFADDIRRVGRQLRDHRRPMQAEADQAEADPERWDSALRDELPRYGDDVA